MALTSVTIKESLEKGVKYEAFRKAADEIKSHRKDYLVEDVARNMWMNDEDGSISFNAGGAVTTLPMTEWSMSQLAGTRLQLPASGYPWYCVQKGHPELAAENINTWLDDMKENKNNRTWQVRSYKNTCDALFSNRYVAFDSPDILDVIEDTIGIDDYRVVGSYVSNERMHLRLIQDKLLSVPGEDLYPGIFIDSSDVGRAIVRVQFGIWKKICTNGLCIAKVGGELFKQRHINVSKSEFRSNLKLNLNMIPQLIEKSENIIIGAAGKSINLKDQDVFDAMVKDVRHAAIIGEEDAKKILELASDKYGSTRWGIVNAMTDWAQQYELDDRLRIENAAGKLITAA